MHVYNRTIILRLELIVRPWRAHMQQFRVPIVMHYDILSIIMSSMHASTVHPNPNTPQKYLKPVYFLRTTTRIINRYNILAHSK